MGPTQARDLVRVWGEHDTVPHTADLILRGISLHQEHSLSFWDALIIQAAIDARCDVLLSEDMQHGRRFGELEVLNPFIVAGTHEPRAAVYSTGHLKGVVPKPRRAVSIEKMKAAVRRSR